MNGKDGGGKGAERAIKPAGKEKEKDEGNGKEREKGTKKEGVVLEKGRVGKGTDGAGSKRQKRRKAAEDGGLDRKDTGR